MTPQRIVILGAAGRDFHNFNVLYRGHPEAKVVAFTAAQIPNISGRRYPPSLAGPGYPTGIPIVPEADLPELVNVYLEGRAGPLAYKAKAVGEHAVIPMAAAIANAVAAASGVRTTSLPITAEKVREGLQKQR